MRDMVTPEGFPYHPPLLLSMDTTQPDPNIIISRARAGTDVLVPWSGTRATRVWFVSVFFLVFPGYNYLDTNPTRLVIDHVT